MKGIIELLTVLWADYGELLIQGTKDTLIMVFASTALSYIIGLPIGILATITDKSGIMPLPWLNKPLNGIINLGRSIPFIILLVALMPFTRKIVGTSIGVEAAILPLTIAAVPFVARMVETSIKEVEDGVIEAARAMGASHFQIVRKVILTEALPSLITGFALTTVTLVSYTAMAGTIGAGGLGDIAIRYGYHRVEPEVMFATIVLTVIIVQVIQTVGNRLSFHIDKRRKGVE